LYVIVLGMEGVNPDPDPDQLSVAVLEVLRRVQVHDGEGLAAGGLPNER